MTTLDELIEAGVKLHNAREEARRKSRIEEEERKALLQAEARRLIASLLPKSISAISSIEVADDLRHAIAIVHLPQGGKVEIYLVPRADGTWVVSSRDDYYHKQRIATYDATNPDGYYCRTFALEEALAYAAGVLQI